PSPRRPRIVSLRPPNRSSAPKPAMIPSDTSPPSGLPPIHCATKIATPRATANVGMNHFVLAIRIEHLLHGGAEEARQRDRERERGRVPLLFDGVDRLPRHVERRRQVPLRQPSRRPQLAHTVPHPPGRRSRRQRVGGRYRPAASTAGIHPTAASGPQLCSPIACVTAATRTAPATSRTARVPIRLAVTLPPLSSLLDRIRIAGLSSPLDMS